MSQSPVSTMQNPNAMKKKVLAALIAVAIGHVAVLFAVSHMQSPELKKIEKEPLKVRFVKITEDAPPPPPPTEPVKPQVQPKPEPKVVEPTPVVKPKIIAEKPKPKVEAAKPIVVDDSKDKLKKEQERLEQERLTQERINQERIEQQKREQAQREQAQRDQQAREQAERQRREQEARNTPRNLTQGQISWVRSPKPAYTNRDLQGADRTVVVSITADAAGKVTDVRVIRSSGIPALDQKVVRAVQNAKFRPYKENGVAYPFKAEQPFELKLNSNG